MPPIEGEETQEALELDDTQQIDDEQDQVEQPGAGDDGERQAEGDDDDQPQVNDEDEDEELTSITFGDEAAEQDQEGDSVPIRQMRKELREAKARIRELEKPVQAEKRELRPKPTSQDHGYDDAAYEADLEAWFKEKSDFDREEAVANEAQAKVVREWQADVQRFEQQRAELKVPDLEDAQEAVGASLNLAQQAVIVKAAENPAVLMYALGKSPAKLAEIAKITDVIKLAAAVAKMEGTVKVQRTTRKKGPAIDKPQNGSAQVVASDKKLAQLEEKAARTGDRTELQNYKRQLKEREASKAKK